MTLAIGQSAPGFVMPVTGGGTLSLVDLQGRIVVLYFYPKDDTSGCTLEAQQFDALAKDFAAAGATVVGVSPDGIKSHDKFRRKYKLGLTLAADEDKAAIKAYGLWVEKSMFGHRYMGVERATVLIGRDGTVARIWRKVKVPGHAAEVLAAAKAL